MTKRYVITLSFIICQLLFTSARAQTMADAFRQMPDSLLPSLTRNNRLDLVDFCEAKMLSVVTNRFDEEVEMTALTPDSLSLRMNPALRIDMKLYNTTETYDSCRQVVCVMHTYQLQNDMGRETVASFYTLKWRLLMVPPVSLPIFPNTFSRQEDELFCKQPVN